MKKYLVFASLALLAFACGKSESGEKTPAASSVNGEKIYKNYCVTCHGLAGDMGGSGAFNLQTSVLTLEQRIEVITNGRNVMPANKDLLSPEKIKAVAEYTMQLKK